MLPEDVVVCRCERVTAGEVQTALTALQIHSTRQSKLLTRMGMGFCQGRICRPVLDQLILQAGGSVAASPGIRPRFPIRPVAMGVLEDLVDANGGPEDEH